MLFLALIYQSTTGAIAHFSISPRDLLKNKDCLSWAACCAAKIKCWILSQKYRSSVLEMVKGAAVFLLKYQVTTMPVYVWKDSHM